MSLYRIPDAEVGGARVVRPFDSYVRGDIIPADDIERWPESNWSAMVTQGMVELIRAVPRNTIRVAFPRDDGRGFDVVEGSVINREPLDEDAAMALAEKTADAARSSAQDAPEQSSATEQPETEARISELPTARRSDPPKKRGRPRMTPEQRRANREKRQEASLRA